MNINYKALNAPLKVILEAVIYLNYGIVLQIQTMLTPSEKGAKFGVPEGLFMTLVQTKFADYKEIYVVKMILAIKC